MKTPRKLIDDPAEFLHESRPSLSGGLDVSAAAGAAVRDATGPVIEEMTSTERAGPVAPPSPPSAPAVSHFPRPDPDSGACHEPIKGAARRFAVTYGDP